MFNRVVYFSVQELLEPLAAMAKKKIVDDMVEYEVRRTRIVMRRKLMNEMRRIGVEFSKHGGSLRIEVKSIYSALEDKGRG